MFISFVCIKIELLVNSSSWVGDRYVYLEYLKLIIGNFLSLLLNLNVLLTFSRVGTR